MIYLRTIAYNASTTLKRAIDSVLNQTYSNFTYYLCENGSTDGGKTRLIVDEYARLDERIVPFYNEQNHVWAGNEKCRNLMKSISSDSYFCQLDADDEYYLTFLEEMLSFMNEYDLDIAACGSDGIDVANNNVLSGQRILPQNLILKGNDFAEYFPIYHQFMRTVWGKLYKGQTIQNSVQDANTPGYPRAYGGDTYNVMRAFRDAQRVGILSKSLHKYYMSASSTSYVMHPERVKSDQILYEHALEYLEPYGRVSPQNDRFIKIIYLNAVNDTLRVLLNARITPLEKMQNILDILEYEATKELFCGHLVAEKDLDERMRMPITCWLFSQKENRTQENIEVAVEILTTMYNHLTQMFTQDNMSYILRRMPEMTEALIRKDYSQILDRIRIWLRRHENDDFPLTELEIAIYHAAGKTDAELFTFLVDVRNKRPKSSEKLNIDIQIDALLKKNDFLKNVTVALSCVIPKTVNRILQSSYLEALDEFIAETNGIEIAKCDEEPCTLLGINLSAAAENADAYICFNKLWVSYLLDSSRVEEANAVLDEFEQILPDDKDFAELRKRLPS